MLPNQFLKQHLKHLNMLSTGNLRIYCLHLRDTLKLKKFILLVYTFEKNLKKILHWVGWFCTSFIKKIALILKKGKFLVTT